MAKTLKAHYSANRLQQSSSSAEMKMNMCFGHPDHTFEITLRCL